MTNQYKYKPISVTLSDQERAVIKGLMDPMGMTFSGALRFIVNDWQRLQETPNDPDHPVRNNVLPGT
jgi:hypothetical protein